MTGFSRRDFMRLSALAAASLSSCVVGLRKPPHVVIVLIDELRKDAADLFAPKLNGLGAHGIVFDQMRTVAPWTYPSVLSLLSGLYPQQHDADGHQFDNRLKTFDRSVPLLPARLREQGYTSSAFITNPFLHDWNPLHEAFDHWDAHFVNSQGNLRGLGELVWNPETMYADSVNRAVVDHFGSRKVGAPEFTYIHYIDVHGPWKGAPFQGDYVPAIHFVDEHVAKLHAFFSDRYDGDVIFLVTSDHGRALADDETVGFGRPWRKNKASLHDFNLRIPCWILPGRPVPAPGRIPGPCTNVDVVPTLLDWIGLEPSVPLPGSSLLPALSGLAALEPRALFARMSAFGSFSEGLVYAGKKYLRYRDPHTGENAAQRIFDVGADPRETRSIGEAFGEMEPVFERESGTRGTRYVGEFEEPSKDTLEQLQALGYLE